MKDCSISIYLTNTFQKHNLLSLAQHTYGRRECQFGPPPNSLSDATSKGSSVLSDLMCVTIRVTFGRPILATTCCAFGEYLIASPPSSCSVFVSSVRLKQPMTKCKQLSNNLIQFHLQWASKIVDACLASGQCSDQEWISQTPIGSHQW